MNMKQNGVTVEILPDGAHCNASENKTNPLEMDDCPIGKEECSGDCFYYAEEE